MKLHGIPTSLLTNLLGVGVAGHIGTGGTQNYVASFFMPSIPPIAQATNMRAEFIAAFKIAVGNDARLVKNKLEELPPDWVADIRGVAYEIPISSRYDRESEMREMVDFVNASNKAGLARYVKSLFYDTKSCCCTIELAEGVDQFSPIADEILTLARETIGQFDWFGTVDHGKPLTEF